MSEKFEELPNCPYCRSEGIEYIYSAPDRFSGNKEELFGVSKCSKCSLVFQSPRVKEEFIGSYYGDNLAYYHVPKNSKKTFSQKLKQFVEKQIYINNFGYTNLGNKNIFWKIIFYPLKRWQKTKLTPDYVSNGRLLEIGCAHGENLHHLRNIGWSVVGQDMSNEMAKEASHDGVNVFAGRVEEMNFQEKEFDVIVASMVMEHLYNPFEVFKKLDYWLKPGGRIIFSIPYFNGIEFKIFKEYSHSLHLPHHITFLNKKIIREYFTRLGYKNIKFYFQFFDRDMVTSAENKYKEKGGFIYRVLSKSKIVRIFIIKPVLYILSLFDLTCRVTVYVTKK